MGGRRRRSGWAGKHGKLGGILRVGLEKGTHFHQSEPRRLNEPFAGRLFRHVVVGLVVLMSLLEVLKGLLLLLDVL